MASAILASRKVTYSAGLELTQLQSDAAKIQSILKNAFENVKIDGSKLFDSASLEQASKQTQAILAQQAQQQKVVAQTALQAERTQTQEARAQAQERISIAKAEEQERIQAAKAAAQQIIEQEKRATEEQRQQRPTQQGSTLTSIGGVVGGAIAGFVSVQALRQVADYTNQLATLRKELLLASSSFTVLSGGATEASSRLNAIKQASGGLVGTLDALKIGNQLTALGLANTAADFTKLTRAAREVTFVSPVIHDIGSALSELSLASANLSFRRLDQLGLTTTEVKQRMAELQAANSGLSDSEAFLAAATDRLEAKYGKLTDTAEAQAQGVDKLKVAWEEFKNALASGALGDAADKVQGEVAGLVNKASLLIGSQEQSVAQAAIQKRIAELKTPAGLGSRAGFGVSPQLKQQALEQAEAQQKALDIQKKLAAAAAAGLPGADKQLGEVNSIVLSIAKWGNASDEQIQRLNELASAADNTAAAIGNLGLGQERATQKAKEAADAAAAEAHAETLKTAKNNLTGAASELATGAVDKIGIDKALEFQAQAEAKVKEFLASIKDLPDAEIPLRVKVFSDGLEEQLNSITQTVTDQIGQNTALTISDTIARGIAESNSSIVDASPALSNYRQQLIDVQTEIALTGQASAEQASLVSYATGVLDSLSSTTGIYAALQNDAGEALLTSNQHAADLATQIAILDGNLASGKISADEHAGALRSLVLALLATAEAAGISGAAIDNLKRILAGLPTSGGPGFERGQRAGDNTADRLAAQDAIRQREENRRAAERIAREQEAAAKRAGKELESAAKRAGNELNSALQSVPGLFSASKVTQDQLDSAKSGIPQNFADDFLRRLRDVADNGTKRNDVSLDQARQALQNIGINPSEDVKQLVRQIEEAWNNSSLFASKDNLALINKEAVDANLALQEKMKQGRQNIQEFFGVVIDDATGAVAGVAKDKADTEKLKQAVTDGKQKLVDDLTGTVNDAVDSATRAGGAPGVTATTAGALSGGTFTPTAISFAGVSVPALPIPSVQIAPDAFDGIFDKLNIPEEKFKPIADSFLTALQNQFAANSIEFLKLGLNAVGSVTVGFTTAVLPDMAGSLLGAMAAQFVTKTPDFKFNGNQVAAATSIGFVDYYNQAQQSQTNLADALRITFGTQVAATRDGFTSAGDNVAGIIDAGFIGHWSGAATEGAKTSTSLSDAFLTKLQTQFGSGDSLTAYETIGSNAGAILGGGFSGYDFSTVAASAISGIQSGFRTEENLTAIYNSGGALANTLHDGFIATVNQATWIADVKDAIVAEVLSDLAAGAEKKQ